MAIDTENERRSVQSYTLGLMRPLADGTIGAEDRSVVSWLYFRSAGPLVPEAAPTKRVRIIPRRLSTKFAWAPGRSEV